MSRWATWPENKNADLNFSKFTATSFLSNKKMCFSMCSRRINCVLVSFEKKKNENNKAKQQKNINKCTVWILFVWCEFVKMFLFVKNYSEKTPSIRRNAFWNVVANNRVNWRICWTGSMQHVYVCVLLFCSIVQIIHKKKPIISVFYAFCLFGL